MGYSSTQKGYKCYHPPTKWFFDSIDVIFIETKNYFPNPYLQERASFIEDKYRDLSLFDLSSLPSSQNQNPLSSLSSFVLVLLPNELDPSTPGPTTKDKQTQSATCQLQVYSRRKKPLVQPM